MSNLDLNLGRMERRSWQMQQQDGLLDLFLGVAAFALGLEALVGELGGGSAVRLATLSGIQFSAAFAMWWARRRWTRPRIGVVRFAPPRRGRIRRMRWILGGCVAGTAGLVLLTAWANWLRPDILRDLNAWIPAATSAAVVLVPLGAMAAVLDMPRLWLHAVLLASALAIGVAIANPPIRFFETVLFGAAGVSSLAIGWIMLARFMQSERRDREERGRAGCEGDS